MYVNCFPLHFCSLLSVTNAMLLYNSAICDLLRGGLLVHMNPKSWHCQKGGGSAPCQDFFGGFVHNALRALQSDHSSPKSDNFPPKCALIPQNRSFNHISLTFSLTKMIYALLSKNVASRIYALLWAKGPRIRGYGGSSQF